MDSRENTIFDNSTVTHEKFLRKHYFFKFSRKDHFERFYSNPLNFSRNQYFWKFSRKYRIWQFYSNPLNFSRNHYFWKFSRIHPTNQRPSCKITWLMLWLNNSFWLFRWLFGWFMFWLAIGKHWWLLYKYSPICTNDCLVDLWIAIIDRVIQRLIYCACCL